MAGCGVRQVGYFAADPRERKGSFEAVADQSIEAGNGEYGMAGGRGWHRHPAIVARDR
ncbi:hypothetical protein SDC9_181402 [bioreactor metagenome]|uniref:Uncharacterized protein n=1 Tax=bioreactor metagenome TaxID=1076179 RepID=A0A645H5C6_9ZZZZ